MKILTILITNLYRRIYLASKNHCSITKKKSDSKQNMSPVRGCANTKVSLPQNNIDNSQYGKKK